MLYLDDVVVMAPSFEQHIERLEKVLLRLRQVGLKLKPCKCEMLQKIIRYLRHIISEERSTDPDKVEAVKDWAPPTHREL